MISGLEYEFVKIVVLYFSLDPFCHVLQHRSTFLRFSSIIWQVGRLPQLYFKSSCVEEGNIWNPVECTTDFTNSQFARYRERGKFPRFYWTLKGQKAFSFWGGAKPDQGLCVDPAGDSAPRPSSHYRLALRALAMRRIRAP